MKIDIGPDGKILGTKRVSPNGQVSGFTEYAGRDVLVVLPGDRVPVVKRDVGDVVRHTESLLRDRMAQAQREYRRFRSQYPTPEAAVKAFVGNIRGRDLHGLLDRAEDWIRDQVQDGREKEAVKKPAAKKTKG